jgi:uncharacterized OB-fold protein
VTIDRNHNVVFENRIDFPYWDGLKKGEVRCQRCEKCGRWTWPAEWRCPACGSWDFHWEAVEAQGEIYAWERTHYPFSKNFKDLLPYVTVLVALPAAGDIRMVGLLLGAEKQNIKIGLKVTPDIQAPSARTLNLPALWWRLAGTT